MSFIISTNHLYCSPKKKNTVHNHIVQVEYTASRLMKQLRLIYASYDDVIALIEPTYIQKNCKQQGNEKETQLASAFTTPQSTNEVQL